MRTSSNAFTLASLFAAVLLLAGTGVNAQTVTFPDANLETAVREAIPKPSGDITVADMLTLTNLTANGRGIQDLTGLETARNLWHLELEWNPITNHSVLSALTNLLMLSISANGTPDIGFVAPLKKLQNLNLYSNGIEDISPLAGLVDLQRLFMPYNPVTNLATLSALTNLVELDIGHDGVTDLSFAAPLRKLERLSLDDDRVSDLSVLAGRTNLVYLNLNWNGATNPAVLATLTSLQELEFCGNNLTNASCLSGLTNLTGLNLAYTVLADMSPLTNLTRLVWLNVGENSLASLPDLASFTNLLTFMMAGNQIADLSPVTRLPVVSQLHLQRNPFQDLSPLTNCPYLYILLFYDNNTITNLSVLGDIPNLAVLYLGNMQITNLSQVDFLATLPGLWQLDLYQNYIADLSPLTNYPSLNWLGVEENRLQQINPLLNLPTLGYVNLRLNYLDTSAAGAAWNVITNLQARGVNVEYDSQLEAPILPHIVGQPANRSAFEGDTVTFTVSLEKNGAWPEFRWQKDGVDLENTEHYYGVDNDTLTIANVTAADAGQYRVRVWRDWAVTNSAAAELLVVTNVAFADASLEQAVRDQLGIPSDPLTPADLAGLNFLDASYRGITNLAGLEAAANLNSLNLSGNPAIAGFTPLAFLASLNELAVNDAGLDNLSWAVDLRSLTALQVNANFIEDLSPLSALPNLQWLSVTENQLTDIDPLLDLPALTGEVQLSWNRLDTNATAAAWGVITNLLARGATVNYDPQYAAPVRPVITQQPVSVAAYPGDNVSFHVETSSSGPNFRWLKNGVNFYDADRIGGTGGDTLYIDNVQAGDAASYRVRIWDDHGVTNSRTVTLRVITNVAFVDPNLEQAVRDQLGIPTRPLTPADLAPMTWLEAWGRGITNLSGIESIGNLDTLILDSNPGLTDLTPLLQLPRLAYLNLNNCGVSDLAFVAALPPLNELHVWGGVFADIAPLLSQTRLLYLNLGNNPGLTNLTVLNSLTRIQGLWIESTGLTNLDFVSHMPYLAELSVWDNAVQDLTLLAAATNLVNLNVGYNHLTNVAVLAGCTALESLSANLNQITDLSFVPSLPHLSHLNVSENPVADLSPLAGLTNLTRLDIGATLATNLALVATLTNLTDLHASQLALTNNLGFLAPLTSLRVLGLSLNGITALPTYPNLARLTYLNLSDNPLASLASVVSRTNLSELHINHIGLSDLSALAGHTNLNNLGLADNDITDLSPLATLPHLHWISLWNNHVQNISALSGLTNLSYVDLRYNWLNTNPGSAAMTVIASLQAQGVSVDYEPQSEAPSAVTLSAPAWLGGNEFRFTVVSAPGATLEIWRSTNLNTWSSIGFVTNATGTTEFTDPAAPSNRSFYRALQY